MMGCLIIIGAILLGLFVVAMWLVAAYLFIMAIVVILTVLLAMAVAYFGGILIAWLVERFMGNQVSYSDVLGSNIGGAIGVGVIVVTVITCLAILIYCLT